MDRDTTSYCAGSRNSFTSIIVHYFTVSLAIFMGTLLALPCRKHSCTPEIEGSRASTNDEPPQPKLRFRLGFRHSILEAISFSRGIASLPSIQADTLHPSPNLVIAV
jgi:hypothetical protein